MKRLYLIAALSACGAPPEEETTVLLEGTAWFARASVDLLGRRPTVEELEIVRADPEGAVDSILDLLDADAFPDRMAWVWNDTVHTAVWATEVDRFEQFNEGWSTAEARAVGLEVPRILSLLLQEGRPLSELLTVEAIPVHADLPSLWPSSGGESWEFGQYTDGRPHAGVLSSSAFWMRYNADATNYNRQRANALARVFLCSDYFDRGDRFDFVFDATGGSVEEAVKNNPACTTCHASLDPLGSFLGGFAERSINFSTERFLGYSALNSDWYQFQVPSAYFGSPGSTLTDLGAMIAADPRFEVCMAKTFWKGVVGESLSETVEVDALILEDLVLVLREGGLRLRPLLEAIVVSERYRSTQSKLMNTAQLAGTISSALGPLVDTESKEALASLVWSSEQRVMGGNTDDISILERDDNPSVSRVLLQEWVAKGVAEAAIQEDLDRPLEDRRLVRVELPLDDASARDLFVTWNTAFTGQVHSTDSPDLDRLLALFEEVGGFSSEEADQAQALEVILRAMIQHPLTAVY
jgi:hypothetical protein